MIPSEENLARMACTMAGHDPDALWPGHYAESREAGLKCDSNMDGRPLSHAWRAYTSPPQFRGTIPEPSLAEQVAARPFLPMPQTDPMLDALERIAGALERIAENLEYERDGKTFTLAEQFLNLRRILAS